MKNEITNKVNNANKESCYFITVLLALALGGARKLSDFVPYVVSELIDPFCEDLSVSVDSARMSAAEKNVRFAVSALNRGGFITGRDAVYHVTDDGWELLETISRRLDAMPAYECELERYGVLSGLAFYKMRSVA